MPLAGPTKMSNSKTAVVCSKCGRPLGSSYYIHMKTQALVCIKCMIGMGPETGQKKVEDFLSVTL